jgi:hypothetical protein
MAGAELDSAAVAGTERALTTRIARQSTSGRQIDNGVPIEEACRCEFDSTHHARLRCTVLRPRQVLQAEHMPMHYIGVLQGPIGARPCGQTSAAT